MSDIVAILLGALHLALDRLLDKVFGPHHGDRPPGRNLVNGNITQDAFPFWEREPKKHNTIGKQ